MGASKTEVFTPEQNKIANIFKAFAHPARIAILEELINKNSCVCGELVSEIGLSQSTISQHLKELKDIGLIQGEISGTKTCYCINPEYFNEAKELINSFLNKKLLLNILCC